MIYDLSEAELPLESDLLFVEDINLLYLIIINKICSAYIEDEII